MFQNFSTRLAIAATLSAFSQASALAGDPPLPPGGTAVPQWTPEQQVTGYGMMEKISPAHVIHRGATVRALPIAQVQIDLKWTWIGQAYDAASHMTQTRSSGVLVLKDGKIVLER